MHFFALAQDLTLDTHHFHRQYPDEDNPQALQLECLYLDVGDVARWVADQLKQDRQKARPSEPDEIARTDPNLVPPGMRLFKEETLLDWPHFPPRLGRISTRLAGNGLHRHTEDQPLPGQLQALRARDPVKQHFRFAIVNGFGANLGDCTIGITAFRVVLQCLRAHFPSLSCDILFGPGASTAMADILGHEPEVEHVRFHILTAAELAQYDGYFDFTDLVGMPRYDELPAVDWVLWWCGLAPQAVPPEHKRNRVHIRQAAWQAVCQHLQARPGQKLLFNPRASIALRTMPPRVAASFARQLLELAPEATLVVDQPLDLQHPRLLDLSAHIDTPETFRALVGQMDGVVTVNSLASHVADACAVPTVQLCVTMPGHLYPYYPFMAALNPQGYEALPAFGKAKVEKSAWEPMRERYEAAWERIAPAQVLALLHEKMALRQAAPAEPGGLSLVEGRTPPRCVVLEGVVPRLRRQRLAPVHAHASERFAHLTQHLLKPGSVCVMACAPDAGIALRLAERMAPHGELIVLEPRAPLARNVEAAVHLAGTACTARVLQAVGLAGAAQARINALEPWSESHSAEWGNLPSVITVPSQTVDMIALARCSALLIQSPMPCVPFISGALETMQRCRPFIFMTPVNREEVAAVCQAAQPAQYDFWAEAALPGTGSGTEAGLLLVGAPRERPVRIEGFAKLEQE